jgi:hypothetical protein
MARHQRMYAVAVRDDNLYLFLRIRRNPRGEIFVIIPMESPDERKLWNPHASYHADGQHFQKSYDRKVSPRQKQRPDSTFRGAEYILTRPIAAHEPRAFKVPSTPREFSEVFELSVHELRPETYRTGIEVDLTEPLDRQLMPVGAPRHARIIQQRMFKDAVPWIVVTLYDIGSLEW